MPNQFRNRRRRRTLVAWLVLATVFVVQCRFVTNGPPVTAPSSPTATDLPVALAPTATSVAPTLTPVTPTVTPSPPPTATPAPSPSATSSPTATLPPTPTPFPTPYCAVPPDDYTRRDVDGHTLSVRTLAMLETAQAIYQGPGDLMRITQGSYRGDVTLSFGTHSGGGAVDISIRDPNQPAVRLWEEADAMVMALRYAGFAAWFRDTGDLGPQSPAHIHAIAVGDRELSPEAQRQVTGEGGYFQGMDGLIPPHGPNPDPHGGPILCPWMDVPADAD